MKLTNLLNTYQIILILFMTSALNVSSSDNSVSLNINPLLSWQLTVDNNVSVKRSKRHLQPIPKLITDCEDLKRLCSDLSDWDDLPVLECVQALPSKQVTDLNERCQHSIWTHTKNLLDDDNLKELLKNVCDDIPAIKKCEESLESGSLFSCAIEHRDEIRSGDCHAFISRLQWVAFADFRLITPFVRACQMDIEKQTCGRLEPQKEVLSQGKTLACLQSKIDGLDKKCQKQVFRLSEIQADNIKFDRQLYLACATDQIRFCPDLKPGDGLVFKCLTQHKTDSAMSENCREHLTRRQKLISKDYRISRGLARACKEDIKAAHCRKGVSEDKEIRLAQILLCLEGVIRNGSKVNPDCQAEMIDHRKILLEDFQLSPEIVTGCADDIPKFCNGVEVGGRTIHCLMEHARPKRRRQQRVSDTCIRALEDIVRQTDAGEDWRVDAVLRDACGSVARRACGGLRSGDARVIRCLLEQLGTSMMNAACEAALVQVQYFVARDFKLDPQLYRACRSDAVNLCGAKRSWSGFGEDQEPENAPLILPCLYRHVYHTENAPQLRQGCLEEIRRVMRIRAANVDLQPEIEEVCIDDLAMYCFDKTAPGEEMQCLETNLDKLQTRCRKVVSEFIEQQAAHVELNPIIRTVCHKMMQSYCEAELKDGKDEGDIMECLISHKNDAAMRAEIKCRAAVEHFQLISLKDYHFTYKFKEACKSYVMNYCPKAGNKADVIECLSERVRNDTIAGNRNMVPKDCRQQLRAQLLQQRENIDFDPKLKSLCDGDITKLCGNIEHGFAKVLECLQNKPEKLSPLCHKAIFRVKKQEMLDNSIDYTLITVCHDMIETYCHDSDRSRALDCLKHHRDDSYFDQKCKMVVLRRMIEQNKDYRFNPALAAACRPDIGKFCSRILDGARDEELDGKMVECLKAKFREAKLSSTCETQVSKILRERALNYRLNPLLRTVCANELEVLCRPPGDGFDDSTGEVEECLKDALLKKRIVTPECKEEVASMIEEARADIHVDPLLQRACSVDLMKYCGSIQQGAGRHIKCLQTAMENGETKLQDECKVMLLKRMEMFQTAARIVPPESLQELYTQVVASPAKRYFIMVAMTIIGFIFIIGLFCGRATRRAMAFKNK